MNELDAVLRAIHDVQAAGRRAALASVVSVAGSSYRRPGARMLVVEDGTTVGGVSGGCLESDVIVRAVDAIDYGEVTLASYDTNRDDDVDFGVGLGCRGVVHLLIEPLSSTSGMLRVLADLRRTHQPAVLATVWRAGGGGGVRAGSHLLYDGHRIRWNDIGDAVLARSLAAEAAEVLARGRSTTTSHPSPTGDVEVLLEYLPPPVRLVVFGGGADVVPLVRLAKAVGWHVTVVDARPDAARRERFPEADVVIACVPEEVPARIRLTKHAVAVVMTHNYRRDLSLLEVLLPSTVGYLGVLGPRARTERLLQELREARIVPSAEQLARLHAPAGLDLGAEGPQEIALAIVAEAQATLARRAPRPLRERHGPIHEREQLKIQEREGLEVQA